MSQRYVLVLLLGIIITKNLSKALCLTAGLLGSNYTGHVT